MLAFRYLRARRREAFISVISFISLIGIALGVATLIIVLAVMNGFRGELIDKILGLNGHFIVQPLGGPLDDYEAVAERIAAVPGVTAVIPLIEGQVLATGPSMSAGALVRGVRERDIPQVPGLSGNVIAGSLAGFDGVEGVAIGARLAESIGVWLGGTVTLMSPNGDVTPFGVTPRRKAYPVVAIFEIGMSEYDATFAFLPFGEAALFFGKPNEASVIELYVDDPDAVAELRPAIDAAIGRQAIVADWRQRNASFFSALEIERNVMFLILTLIVIVAALNIVSGLTMLVKDKGSNIAILRTLGATRGAILRVFFMTGAAIGTIGTGIGFLLGVILAPNVDAVRSFIARLTGTELFSADYYFLSRLPSDLDPGETFLVVVMGLALSYLATIYPAWRAARLDPVEALRYE